MKIIPAIDLQNGNCVRLYQGQFNQSQTYSDNPIEMAKQFAKEGARELHIVDLDGARDGVPSQKELISTIKSESGLSIQTGGGIRDREQIKALFEADIDRVVIGSLAVSKPISVKQWLTEFGPDRIILALDVRCSKNSPPMVATEGWQQSTALSLWDLLDLYSDTPLRHVLCTDISRDGTLQGPNIELYQRCQEIVPSIAFQASGGLSQLSELGLLAANQLSAVIIGKAFYEKRFTYQEASSQVLKIKGEISC